MANLNDLIPLIRGTDKPSRRPFYYGQGGIGDFLLLMSTFYDDIEQDEVNVFFPANNVSPITKLTEMFPKVYRFYIPSGPIMDPSSWSAIENNPLCLGTGVTPKGFNYIQDWIECGKSNVFDYYGVKRSPDWAKSNATHNSVVIQPFGGADDPTKKKEIPRKDIYSIIDAHGEKNITFMGSEEDTKKYPRYRWITDFAESFDHIKQASKFYGCDSWGKTLAGLANVPTKVYPNQYNKPLEQIFGHPKDPSDYVFLEGWGFDYASD